MQMISSQVLTLLFEDDDPNADIWIGAPLEFFGERELIPFRFMSYRYVMIFQCIGDAVGNPDYLEELAVDFADGFVPHPDARIMKFLNADAKDIEQAFDPDLWQLPDRKRIWEFLSSLQGVVEMHVSAYPETEQYFYAAASPQLEKCYAWIYAKLPDESCLADFEKIQESVGNYHGYQRKKTGQQGNFANEAGECGTRS